MKKISFIIFVLLGLIACSDDSGKSNNTDSTSVNNETTNTGSEDSNSPKKLVETFIKELGEKKFKEAYEKSKVKSWGDYNNFSSQKSFGGITGTEIRSIEQLADQDGKAVISAEVFYKDPVNGDKTFNQNFFLQQFSGVWKIVDLKINKNDVVKIASDVVEKEILSFVTPKNKVLYYATGDVDNDNIEDVILVLCKINEGEACDGGEALARPMLILKRDKDKKLKLAAKNDKIIMCCSCGGMMGDPFQDIEIKNGKFTVSHYGGSSERWSVNTTFAYNSKENNFILEKIEQGNYNVNSEDPEKDADEKTYTEKDFGKVNFKDYDSDKSY